MKHYKVIRTYDDGNERKNTGYAVRLQKAFDDGYEFVRASEYVPEKQRNGIINYGYIEYIVAKEQDADNANRD